MLLREGFYETRLLGNRLLAPDFDSLFVPPLVLAESYLAVQLGTEPVFAVFEEGITKTYSGLAEHIRIDSPRRVYIFDNHNYALAYWLESAFDGLIPGESNHLVHVDQHSDLRPNESALASFDVHDRTTVWNFAHEQANVGNYIVPALQSGFIGKLSRFESEATLLACDNFAEICRDSILNIDLDFFAPEMEIQNTDLSISILRSGMATARVVTIATSPYFLDQDRALDMLARLCRDI